MRSSEIIIGERYRFKEWSKPIRGWTTTLYGLSPSSSRGFSGYWRYRDGMVIRKEGQRFILECEEYRALHRIPELPMRWKVVTCEYSVTPAKIVRRI